MDDDELLKDPESVSLHMESSLIENTIEQNLNG